MHYNKLLDTPLLNLLGKENGVVGGQRYLSLGLLK